MTLELEYVPANESGLRDAAASENKVLPLHRWVPWIAGFNAHFVEDVMNSYLPHSNRGRQLILDPFAGVGTTLIEALKAGRDTVGYEINPFAALVSTAKINCVEVHPVDFRTEVDAFRNAMLRFEEVIDRRWAAGEMDGQIPLAEDLQSLKPAQFKSRIAFFSPPVEAKFLYALARSRALLEPDRSLFRSALGATMVSFSNYTYEPSLASRPGSGKPLVENAAVAVPLCRKLDEMLTDIEWARQTFGYEWLAAQRKVVEASYFESRLRPSSVSLVVTSPPYMNNYHYVRNTRPQLHWLGLVANGGTVDLERANYGKFWQTVRQGKQIDLDFEDSRISARLDELRSKNTHKGYYGGSGWANYVATYLNDSNRFIMMLHRQLRSGGRAVIVVGNSIIQGIEFRIDQILAQLAEQHGLVAEGIHLVRNKRVGNSIIDSSVRNGDANGHRERTQLYDAAVVLKR